MSYHTPAPWPVAGRVALALVLASSVAACTEEEKRSTDAVLAAFGVPGVEPPVYAAVVDPVTVEPAPTEPVAYEPPPPACYPIFRVRICHEDGTEEWL